MTSNFVLYFAISVLLGIFPRRGLLTTAKVRVVTWNVADNKQMNGSFTDEAIDKVLGLDKTNLEMSSIYAIGLQENCWMCNKQHLPKIGKRFISRIHRRMPKKYKIIGIQGTRISSLCEIGCLANTHGATVLLVIARKSLKASHTAFRHNHGCSSTFPRNKEKGVAAMKVELKGNKTVCFATTHLESRSASKRRSCLKNFFKYGDKKYKWTKSCDAQFIFGDFNTRTGGKIRGKTAGKHFPKGTDFGPLKMRDELSGANPYGTNSKWKSNLLSYINRLQNRKQKKTKQQFLEGPFDFMPTYSLKSRKELCDGKFPCYRTNRPMSWTDRIIYTRGERLEYDAIYEDYSNHLPVFAEFTLPL